MILTEIEVLIPTYNEEKNIKLVIDSLKNIGIANITILDGQSEDQTVLIAKNLGCNILIDRNKKMGFGYSLINGIKNSKSKYICVYDADNSFDEKSIITMFDLLSTKNYDFVFGSRYLFGNKSEDDTFVSKVGNFFFTKLISILFKFKSTDALFLYVMGKRDCFLELDLKERDFKICTEILIKAYTKFNCKEIFSHERKRMYGISKVNRLLDGYKILINILKLYSKKND